MVIQCRITPTAANPVIQNTFTVTMRDECYDTVIMPIASRASYSIDLFFSDERSFSPAGQTKPSCGNPVHQIRLIDSTAVELAIFTLDDITGTISVNPQSLNNIGVY